MLNKGDKVNAIMPNGEIEKGIVIERDGRLWLDEGMGNVYAINGGFANGTMFEPQIENRGNNNDKM